MKKVFSKKLANRAFKKSLITVFLTISLVTAFAVNQTGQMVPDSKVFNKSRVIPLGTGILSAVICNKLFDGHGSKDGWTAVCGLTGYFASTAFLKQHNNSLETNRTGQTSS